MKVKPVIIGIAGTDLTLQEKELFTQHRPLGVILFRRNIATNDENGKKIQDKQQLIELIASIKEVLGEQCIIAIDQEGGRVKKLIAPTFKSAPSAKTFADIAEQEGLEIATRKCKQNYKEIAEELKKLGFNLNFAPVADVRHEGAHDIVGDRSFGSNPDNVIRLCQAALEGLAEGGIRGCIKHIPGHGRATADSHLTLPTVEASLEELKKTDFAVFKELAKFPASKLAMTAHIIYKSLDPDNPATLSKKVIDYIKNDIAFKGLIISDAIDMKALLGKPADITAGCFAAGIDIVLECTGNIDNMTAILATAPLGKIKDFSDLFIG
ncbi:beta-N-acetylhexosaminidase [Rickettsia endosymbiont of Halotydeus destructor]|uniref:beta-N-acetylhexosaminidase n=1 Tax=Rickettsia endosymbiont of Halotydeus destructor TaxID=2996754 RepID=UPI003BAEDCDC